MHKYTIQDFCKYYRDAYIRIPDKNSIGRVIGPADNQLVTFEDASNRNIETVPLNSLEWSDVQEPYLGYRNRTPDKGLYYLVRGVGRIQAKGFSVHTTRVEMVPEIYATLMAMGKLHEANGYVLETDLDRNLAIEAFKPTFVKLNMALALIKNKANVCGLALNHDFAIVQGLYKHNAYILLWKQMPIAHSPDGKTWNVISSSYKDVINRGVGELEYAA